MKKYLFLLLTSVIIGMTGLAQNIVLQQGDYSSTVCRFTLGDIDFNPVQVAGRTFSQASFTGSVPSTRIGAPDLPVFSQLVEIPLCADIFIKVSQVQVKRLSSVPGNYPLMPVQPAPSKSDTMPIPFVLDSVVYSTDSFYSLPPAWVERVGVARDRNLTMLRISPLSYNPVTGEMQVITSMTITLSYAEPDVAATRRMRSLYYSPDFSVGHSVLAATPETKEVRRAAPLHYLIVAHESFRNQLDSFINWKKRQGFIVTVAYTGDSGVGSTNTSIANYIKSYYTQATPQLPAPTFLLLVGDYEQIPAFYASCGYPVESPSEHVTDLNYACWTEGDHIPDCYYGRFSARTLNELTPQIEKTIYYESYSFVDDNYLNKGALIAGVDRRVENDNAYTYADPTMDYIASYYINAANHYSDVYYSKNNVSFAPAGVRVSGSSGSTATATALRSLYSQGCGWVNYSAHGYDNEWSIPLFNTSHVSAMNNNNMPSVMVGNCCLSGKFNTSRYDCCLGEALLRKDSNAGAVVYIGATNSTYWPHDFCWSVGVRSNFSNTMNTAYNASNLGMYDRLFHTHGEPFSAWHNTAGSMVTAGNMSVQSYSTTYSYYYWEIYELFGDPSLMPWLGTASAMPVSCSPYLGVENRVFSFTAVPYAYAALTTAERHDLVCAAYADADGVVTFELPSNLDTGSYELAVWAQNYIPYFQSVEAMVLNGPLAVIENIQSEQDCLTPGSTVSFTVTVANIGNQPSSQGQIVLESSVPGLVIAQPQVTLPPLAPGDTVVIPNVWFSYIDENLADQTIVQLTATAMFDGRNTATQKQLSISAPSLSILHVQATPVLTSDSSSTISCHIANMGHISTSNLTFSLIDPFGFTTGNIPSCPGVRIAPDSSCLLSFPVVMASNLPQTQLPFILRATDGQTDRLIGQIYLRAGQDETEEFETGDFSLFEWTQGDYPWTITRANPFAGEFSARSAQNLPNRSESVLSIDWTSTVDDTISFYYRVSSEEGYDKFFFYIDETEMLSASGEEGWDYALFPVAAGTHTFEFIYRKDYYVDEGSDCAWIDKIHFPFNGQICTMISDTVCKGSAYTFAGRVVPTDQTGIVHDADTLDGIPAYLSLSVVDQPDVQIQVLGTPAFGGCVLLKATGADSYQWSTGDSTDCIAVCPEQGSSYSVTGCRHECCNNADITLLGINPVSATSPVALYPNPARHHVTIASEHIGSVQLINLMGQSVMRLRVDAPSVTIPIQNLPKGVYFVRVETGKAVSTEKLVVK